MEIIKKYTEYQPDLAILLDALANPVRLQIIKHFAQYEECPAGTISKKIPLSKSTISQHIAKLKEAGLISCIPDTFLLSVKKFFYF